VIPNSAVTTLESESVCRLNRILEIYDTNIQAWIQYTPAIAASYPWITSWTAATGALPAYSTSSNGFTVLTADYGSYDNELIPPTTWKMRMKVQDYYSSTPTALVYD